MGLHFLIVKFSSLDRYFIVPYDIVERKWDRMKAGGRKSITLTEFEKTSVEIEPGFMPRLDYLKAIEMSLIESLLMTRLKGRNNI